MTDNIKGQYSSTQVNVPDAFAKDVIITSPLIIDSNDLTADGFETDIHITVKYGLTTSDPSNLIEKLKGQLPLNASLGRTRMFSGEEFDVIYVEVYSPSIIALNKFIRSVEDTVDTHPTYVPHMTLAYVKPGTGAKYIGNRIFEGKQIDFNELVFSSQDKEITIIPFDK